MTTNRTHREAVADAFRDALGVFVANLDDALDLLADVDPALHESADAYGVTQVGGMDMGGGASFTEWLTDISVALDGLDLAGDPVDDRDEQP